MMSYWVGSWTYIINKQMDEYMQGQLDLIKKIKSDIIKMEFVNGYLIKQPKQIHLYILF